MSKFKYKFSAKDVEQLSKLAKQRYDSNRKAKNPNNIMSNSQEYDSDLVSNHLKNELCGLIAEFTTAKLFNLEFKNGFIPQTEFRKIKNNIKDVGEFEIRSSFHKTPALILHKKDIKKGEDTKFILAKVNFDEHTCELMGWITVAEGTQDKFWCTNKKYMPYKAGFRIEQNKLYKMDTI